MWSRDHVWEPLKIPITVYTRVGDAQYSPVIRVDDWSTLLPMLDVGKLRIFVMKREVIVVVLPE